MRKLLHIEPYSAVHEAACRDVLKRVFGEDDVSQGYRLTPRRTTVATLQGRLIGFGSIHTCAAECGAIGLGWRVVRSGPVARDPLF